MSIYDKCWELVDLLPRGNKFVGYDECGEKAPLLNGQLLWDVVTSRVKELTLPENIVAEYKSAFNDLKWKEEWIVTQEAVYSMRHNQGLMSKVESEKGYTKLSPVLDDWTLPIKPDASLDKEVIWQALIEKVKSDYFKSVTEQIKESVWQQWLDLATVWEKSPL